METFQEVAESQQKKGENEDAKLTAGLLDKLTVEEKKTEDKSGEDVPASKDVGKAETEPNPADGKKKSEPASSA